jgi:hypothetical protein
MNIEPLLKWSSAYPNPKSMAARITAQEVAALLRDNTQTPADFAIIDVRRDDRVVSHDRYLVIINDIATMRRAVIYREVLNGPRRHSTTTFRSFLINIQEQVGSSFIAIVVMSEVVVHGALDGQSVSAPIGK